MIIMIMIINNDNDNDNDNDNNDDNDNDNDNDNSRPGCPWWLVWRSVVNRVSFVNDPATRNRKIPRPRSMQNGIPTVFNLMAILILLCNGK